MLIVQPAFSGINSMSNLVLGGYFQCHVKNIRMPSQPILKEIMYNNIWELSLTRSIARKLLSFGGFKRISPTEVEASTKARFSEKVKWHAEPDLRTG